MRGIGQERGDDLGHRRIAVIDHHGFPFLQSLALERGEGFPQIGRHPKAGTMTLTRGAIGMPDVERDVAGAGMRRNLVVTGLRIGLR
jgi:hypothetical protein